MTTLNQSLKRKKDKKKKDPILNNSPQRKVAILKTTTMSPKKPNSANRKIAIVQLSDEKKIKVYIPGENSKVAENSMMLIKGGGPKDLPGIKYRLVLKNTNASDFKKRLNKRSKYGVKKIINRKKK